MDNLTIEKLRSMAFEASDEDQSNFLHSVADALLTAQPQASAAQSAPAGERDSFEAWLSSLKFVSGQGQAHVEYCLHRDLSDKYTTEWVSDMYRGWQARAALAASTGQEVES